MIRIVLRRMLCLLAVSQDSIQREESRMSVHNPPRLVILAAIGLLRDEPSAISALSIYPESSTHHSSWLPSLADAETLRPWCPAGPFAACLWGLMLLTKTLQAVLDGLDALLARRFTPGE